VLSNLLNQALMNTHLVHVPGLASLTTWRLPRCDLQVLGRQADGAFQSEVLIFGALDELLADLFKGLHAFGGQSNADAVDFLPGR